MKKLITFIMLALILILGTNSAFAEDAVEQSLGYTVKDVYDTAYSSGETIVIDGTLDEVTIVPDAFEYSAEPGDSGEITYTFENDVKMNIYI